MSVNSALVRFTYPSQMLGRALGINALVVGTFAAIGPTMASGVLAIGHWRWLFALNVPIGIVTAIIAFRSLPDSDRARTQAQLAGRGVARGRIRSADHGAAGVRAQRGDGVRGRADRRRVPRVRACSCVMSCRAPRR